MPTKTGAPTLCEFLLARIAEDEAAARMFARPNGTPGVGWIYGRDVDSDRRHDADAFEGPDGPADPDRVLRECEAKRRIVERLRGIVSRGFGTELHAGVLMDLAAVYADHPDYRDEWAQ